MNQQLKALVVQKFYEVIGGLLHQSEEVNINISEDGDQLLFKLTFDDTDYYTAAINVPLQSIEEDEMDKHFYQLWFDIMGTEENDQ